VKKRVVHWHELGIVIGIVLFIALLIYAGYYEGYTSAAAIYSAYIQQLLSQH